MSVSSYVVTFVGPPGLGTTDIFANAVGEVFALQGRRQGPASETRTSTSFAQLFDLISAIRSEDDTALDWSPWV